MDAEVIFIIAGLATIAGSAAGVWGIMKTQGRANRKEWKDEITQTFDAAKEVFKKDFDALEEKLAERIQNSENSRGELDTTLRGLIDQQNGSIAQQRESINTEFGLREKAVYDKIKSVEDIANEKIASAEKITQERIASLETQTKRNRDLLDSQLANQATSPSTG